MKHIILAILSLAIAVYTNIVIQALIVEEFKPVGEKCASGNYEGLISFEPWLGGFFVCIITTFFHGLTLSPEGGLAWGVILSLLYPITTLVLVESTRRGVKGLLKYPIILVVVGQYIAISVATPLLWVPSYLLWGRGTSHTFNKFHQRLNIFICTWWTFLSLLLFTLDTKSYSWTFLAGVLGGPFAALPYLGQFVLPSSLSSNPYSSSQMIIKLYNGAMICSFIVWACVISWYLAVKRIDGSIWRDANAPTKVIAIDVIGWFISMLIVVWNQNPMDAIRATLMAFVVGPGTALAYALLQQEHHIASNDTKQA